jgi:hypothetical protein
VLSNALNHLFSSNFNAFNCNIGGTIFPQKNIHQLTWKSPDGRTTNQIDHIIVNNKWKRSLHNVRAYKGADVNSDHYLLKATIRLNRRKSKLMDVLVWEDGTTNIAVVV